MARNSLVLLLLVIALAAPAAWASVPQLQLLQTVSLNATYGNLYGLTYYDGMLWTASSYDYPLWEILGVAPATGTVTTEIPVSGISSSASIGGLATVESFLPATVSTGSITSISYPSGSTASIPSAGSAAPPGWRTTANTCGRVPLPA